MGFTLLLLSSTDGWSLPPCPGSYNKTTWTNCFGTYTFASGDKYVGEFRDGTPNGQGTYTHAKSGNKYVGEQKDGNRHGWGTYTFANGGKYVGEYKNGKRHGQGTYTWAKGHKYVGEYKNGEEHGQGIRYRADGTVFQEGIFENGKFLYIKIKSPINTQKKSLLNRAKAQCADNRF